MAAHSKTSQTKVKKSGGAKARKIPGRGPNAPPVLFPEERTSIPEWKIAAAVKAVIAERRAAEKRTAAAARKK